MRKVAPCFLSPALPSPGGAGTQPGARTHDPVKVKPAAEPRVGGSSAASGIFPQNLHFHPQVVTLVPLKRAFP